MTIETKFNIGDFTIIICGNKIMKKQISDIIPKHKYGNNISYEVLLEKGTIDRQSSTIIRDECNCFRSLEELVEYYKDKL